MAIDPPEFVELKRGKVSIQIGPTKSSPYLLGLRCGKLGFRVFSILCSQGDMEKCSVNTLARLALKLEMKLQF